MFADLKPYICTFSGCKDELVTFPTRKLWEDHEFTQHRVDRSWKCSDCPQNLTDPNQWRDHLEERHGAAFSDSQFDIACKMAEQRKPQPIESHQCPLCLCFPGKSKRNFATHVGKHMEGIALAALPRETTSDSESDDETLAGTSPKSPQPNSPKYEALNNQPNGRSSRLSTPSSTDPYSTYEGRELMAIGVLREGKYCCQYLSSPCQERFHRPEDLQLHFETVHFSFLWIADPQRYICLSCQGLNISATVPCSQCGNSVSTEVWIYGEFLWGCWTMKQSSSECPQNPNKGGLEAIPNLSTLASKDEKGTPCQRCRKSKKRCDRQRPCQRCTDANINADQCVSEDEGHDRKAPYAHEKDVSISPLSQIRSGNWHLDGTAEERKIRERKEEIRRIKEAEEDALAHALGLPVAGRTQTGANAVSVGEMKREPYLILAPLDGEKSGKVLPVPNAPQTIRIGCTVGGVPSTQPKDSNGFFDARVISRKHAEIWADGVDEIWIRDVASANGTFVNGDRLSEENRISEPVLLSTEDILEFGTDIVAEDGETVVYPRVALRVEYAGLLGIADLTKAQAQLNADTKVPEPPPAKTIPSQKYSVGTEVAFYPSALSGQNWLHGTITVARTAEEEKSTRYNYDVREKPLGQIHMSCSPNSIIPIAPAGLSLPELEPRKQVLVLYPEQSRFYKARVNHTGDGGNWVRVVLDEEEPGRTLDIERRFVLEYDEERYGQTLNEATMAQASGSREGSSQPIGNAGKMMLPRPEFLAQIAGIREGQVQRIQDLNGSVSAYSWSASKLFNYP